MFFLSSHTVIMAEPKVSYSHLDAHPEPIRTHCISQDMQHSRSTQPSPQACTQLILLASWIFLFNPLPWNPKFYWGLIYCSALNELCKLQPIHRDHLSVLEYSIFALLFTKAIQPTNKAMPTRTMIMQEMKYMQNRLFPGVVTEFCKTNIERDKMVWV